MTKRYIVSVLSALLLTSALPGRAAPLPLDVYAILSLTGPAAFLGHGEQAALGAFERTVNDAGGINGQPVSFVIQDDQSNPTIAVQLVNQITAKGAPVFIGPSGAASCGALLPMVTNGPVMYCLSNALHPPGGSFGYSVFPSTKDFAATALRYLKARGVRKLALLTSTDAGGVDGEQIALENLKLPEFAGMQVVANEHFAPGDLTVSAQMSRIKASGAQAIDAWVTGTPFATALHGIQDGGWEGIVMTNGGNVSATQMEQYDQIVPGDLIFPAPPYMAIGNLPARVQQARTTYINAMRQAGVATPDLTNIIAWDAMLVIVDALRHLGATPTAAQVHDYIAKLHDFAGINGMYDFRRGDQRGVDPLGSVVVRWDKTNKTFITISKPGGTPL